MEQVSYRDGFKVIGVFFVIIFLVSFAIFFLGGWKLILSFGFNIIGGGFFAVSSGLPLSIALLLYLTYSLGEKPIWMKIAFFLCSVCPFTSAIAFVGLYYVYKNRKSDKQKKANIIICNVFALFIAFALGGYIGSYLGEKNHDEEQVNQIDIKNEGSDGYTDLGPIDCNIQGVTEDRIGGLMTNYHLYLRNSGGEKRYFADNGEKKYYPITKGTWTKEGVRFNGRFHRGSSYYYLNISSWYDDNDNYDDDHVRNGPIRRDPVPVQEWVPCTGCNGSGKCNNCNGTGQNLYSTNYMECIGCGGSGRCEFCAGQGGHYETRFR